MHSSAQPHIFNQQQFLFHSGKPSFMWRRRIFKWQWYYMHSLSGRLRMPSHIFKCSIQLSARYYSHYVHVCNFSGAVLFICISSYVCDVFLELSVTNSCLNIYTAQRQPIPYLLKRYLNTTISCNSRRYCIDISRGTFYLIFSLYALFALRSVSLILL